jgi:PAS domain S-box-containing protein
MTEEKAGRGNGSRVTGDITGSRPPERDLRGLDEEWRSLAENIPDIILTVDADGTILFINRTVSGEAIESVVGASVYDYAPQEQHDALRERLGRVFERGQAHSFEMGGPGAFGRPSWYFSRIGPIVRDGRVVAAALITTDITQRKQAEEALRESEERYRDLVEDINDIVFSVNAAGRITYISPVVTEVGGYSPSEMVGRPFTDFLHPDDVSSAMEGLRRSIAGDHEPVEMRFLSKSGELRWLRNFGRPKRRRSPRRPDRRHPAQAGGGGASRQRGEIP